MAQVGTFAYQIGLVKEVHACLTEMCTGTRNEELLAQRMQAFNHQERDFKQERLEHRRQVKYHMHINMDLLETSHLISAILLDVTSMVNLRLSYRKRAVSKANRKLLVFHERLVSQGPPGKLEDTW
uniref:Eukaryotic translation initiation factor 3 subunit C putative n=1 Tax=Albugo laibachii Nc14 TaxID=890382 RepID=F0WWA1_9STRA|nr:eukaryotic translation initiation factor 3 subunit C putative [Albugo laibachii Nc14]|eukprot:CCA25721.1 eukaryotic translation initiation factor 3 subunit C putative [Albugo laibachii Nc14]